MIEGYDASQRAKLDKFFEPKLTAEEQAEAEAEEARQRALELERLEETWGMSAEAQAGAAKMASWAGAEG